MSTQFAELITSPTHDVDWLRDAIQAAIDLEFFTIPPYLTAMWSVKDQADPVAQAIRHIVHEEMLHMALACNMLVAIGGTPKIDHPDHAPRYPAHLPGGVKPGLQVGLEGLSLHSIRAFMEIEEPEEDISRLHRDTEGLIPGETFARIGEFYDAIEAAFENEQPALEIDRQITGHLAPMVIQSLDDVRSAISIIKSQGEGSTETPESTNGKDLAHYYRFKEMSVGRKINYDTNSKEWVHGGDLVALPECWPVGEVPPGGYLEADVPRHVYEKLVEFDGHYSSTLHYLQQSWESGGQGAFHHALECMFLMQDPAVALMRIPMADLAQNYGPCFRRTS